MARFDVYANPSPAERQRIPYFLNVQNDHVQGLATRAMVPLWGVSAFTKPAEGLNPALEVQGVTVIMDTAAIGAVPLRALKGAVTNLLAQQLPIQNALDVLFGAY